MTYLATRTTAMNGAPAQSGHDYAATIRRIGGHTRGARDLDESRAFALFAAMLAGDVPTLELGAILIALRLKGESLAETVGFMRALDAQVGRLEAPSDRPRPVVLPSYNGARRMPNLTALLALLLKRYGVPVLIHGPGEHGAGHADDPADDEPERAVPDTTYGRVTTLEILLELGIEPARSLADAQRMLNRHGIVYAPTAVLAPSIVPLLDYRARLGVRSCAHSLVKLIEPFGGEGYRVVAVTHPDYVDRMREFLLATHARALLLRGTEGEPFANPRRQVQIESFVDGVATVCAEKEIAGVADAPTLPAAIDAATTAAWITDVLAGAIPVPTPLIAQLACCLRDSQRPVTAA